MYVDFQNTDAQGRVRLNTIGTIEDLSREGIALREGLEVKLDSDEFESVHGTVRFSEEESIWVASFKAEDLRSQHNS
jgi:hypothetical protein